MNPTVPDALAHCLATEGPSRPIAIEALGTFHVRRYAPGAKHAAGVLFLSAPELREALTGETRERDGGDGDGDDADEVAGVEDAGITLSFAEWLGKTSGQGAEWAETQLKEMARTVREALVAGREHEWPTLGRFSTKLTAAKTITDDAGTPRAIPPRKVACFTPSDALRKRLSRT